MVTMPSTNEELYYQVASSQKLEQDNRHRQLELKATAVLAVAATLLGLASFTASQWTSWSIIPGIVLLAAFGWTALWAVVGLKIRQHHASPQLQELSDHIDSGKFGPLKLTEWVADALTEAVKFNEAVSLSIAGAISRAVYGLAVEAFALGMLMISVGVGVVLQ